jgi:hypothetical protein
MIKRRLKLTEDFLIQVRKICHALEGLTHAQTEAELRTGKQQGFLTG